MSTNKRLLSLDILRGITIAGMILVNNPGSWSYVYTPLKHADWHGLTPTDLVFPFFMFIMGISTYISLRKFSFQYSKETLFKIAKRVVIIFLIGVAISWLSLSTRTFNELTNVSFIERFFKSITNFENLRTLGVMQRLAITYGVTALVAITVKHKYIPHIIIITLLGYFFLLYFNNGFEFSTENIISKIDRALLGESHMYKDNGVVLDPEGLLSTIPSICHVMIGFLCGRIVVEGKDNSVKTLNLFIVGAILTFVGFLLSYGCPINKKIWSPTFVLTTCGLASTLQALLIWIIDSKGYKKWSQFFESFGVNPLFIYVAAGVISIILRSVYFQYKETYINLQKFLYNEVLQPLLGNYPGSLAFALCFITVCWLISYILYKKRIFIKI